MKIMLSRQTTSGLGALAERTISTSEKPEYDVVKNNPLLASLKTEYANYFAVFGKKAYSGMGDAVRDADVLRDSFLGGVKDILLGYSKLTGYEFQQDAIDLYAIIEHRGLDLDTYSYADESSEMDKLIEEFDKRENVAKLNHLNLIVPVAMLKTHQTNFKTIFSKQVSSNAQLRLKQSATSTRGNLENALHNYLNIVDAMKSLDGWSVLNAELNEIVKAASNSRLWNKHTLQSPPVPMN